MKYFLFFGTLTAVLLALFLVLRPAVSAIGSPATPDTAGRAKELLPEERVGVVAGNKPHPKTPPVAGAAIENVEQQVLALTNEARRAAGLPPLTLDDSLRRAARNHARDMIERSFQDSINPDGLSAEDRVSRENRRAVSVVAENIGTAPRKEPQLAKRIVDDWLANPSDRQKVLQKEYAQIGIGVVPSATDVRAVQLLARTVALTALPVPEKVGAGSKMRVELANASTPCQSLDVFSPDTGLVAAGPAPPGDLVLNVAPGVYKLRVRCDASGGARVYAGPRFEVTP